MITTHSLGFPRIGEHRELKFALEKFWRQENDAHSLLATGASLRHRAWRHQQALDYLPVGDFSFYDHVLDMSFLLGHVPERVAATEGCKLARYFRAARGRSAGDKDCQCTRAGEMTKWFNTNYHYIVPEFSAASEFSLHAEPLIAQIIEAQQAGHQVKPVIIGPLTYLWLGKSIDGSDKHNLLTKLLPVYSALLEKLDSHGVEWVQIDEPILVCELDRTWRHAFELAYHHLKSTPVKLMLTTYFGELADNLRLACELPVAALHIDVSQTQREMTKVIDWLPSHKILSLGVIDGRNIWKSDFDALLTRLEPIADKLQSRLWLAPSCSLLHVPIDLENETSLDTQLRSWLAFAVQKITELSVIATALNQGREAVVDALEANARTQLNRRNSTEAHHPQVREKLKEITPALGRRKGQFKDRIKTQQADLKLPPFPTTTIGSFPQTGAIRQTRARYRKGEINKADYEQHIKNEIAQVIGEQEKLDLDVLVHGEAERNDMVEYFAEYLEGYAITKNAWVQSYGSRCVKPPILFGDIQRSEPITVEWIRYAQSLTARPVKGMLTGPVTMLNWSFVRDDQSLFDSCAQLALAIREEVLDLEKAGVSIIQIDEAALREGLPLKYSEWQEYLDWAVDAFRLAANGVKDSTQIHTHMCYSEFNDIMPAITRMDADVITIETSRSNMELLEAFQEFYYPNDIGPGVYDIHSPNTPTTEAIVNALCKAAQSIPEERLWVNPDCGLKTRRWQEVLPALNNMVAAAKQLRKERHHHTAINTPRTGETL